MLLGVVVVPKVDSDPVVYTSFVTLNCLISTLEAVEVIHTIADTAVILLHNADTCRRMLLFICISFQNSSTTKGNFQKRSTEK